MHRFFLTDFRRVKERIQIFDSEQVHQIKNVLRLKPGEEVVVFDSGGQQFLIILESINNFIIGKILKEIKKNVEPKIKINLYQALLKKDKFEQIVKWGTSLGINKFVPVVTERSIVREVSEEKLKRWQKIIKESAEQSGRVKIPEISQPVEIKSLFKNDDLNNKNFLNLIAERQGKQTLKQILNKNQFKIVNLFIGPEGGFSPEEMRLAQGSGLKLFHFGQRVLPAEFAGPAIVSAIFFHYQEL